MLEAKDAIVVVDLGRGRDAIAQPDAIDGEHEEQRRECGRADRHAAVPLALLCTRLTRTVDMHPLGQKLDRDLLVIVGTTDEPHLAEAFERSLRGGLIELLGEHVLEVEGRSWPISRNGL